MTIHLLIKVICSPWFWVDVFFGSAGAWIVVRGLKLESRAEKFTPPENFNPDIFADIIARQKALMDRGQKLVVAGCVIEAIAAFILSVISGLEIVGANETAAAALLQAGVATNRTAQIEQTNLLIRSNVATLEAEVQWRTITPEQESTLINLLTPFITTSLVSRKPVGVEVWQWGDWEAAWYANKIRDVLKKCGFEVVSPGGYSITGYNPMDPAGYTTGLDITENAPTATDDMRAIVVAFAVARIPLRLAMIYTNTIPDGTVTIKVWHKPEK